MNSALGPENNTIVVSPEYLRTVAIMEDSRTIQEFVQDKLQEAGFLVLLATNADECEHLAQHACSAFILDLDMGAERTEEGLEALRRLKALNRDIYCILLTHHREDRFKSTAKRLGCDAFLGKSSRELLEDFDQVLLALDRMLLGRVTDLALNPADRSDASEISSRVELIRTELIRRRPLIPNSEKQVMVSRYQGLLAKEMTEGLSDDEKNDFDVIEQSLTKIETVEADEFDSRFSQSRAGRLEASLNRIEEYLLDWQGKPGA